MASRRAGTAQSRLVPRLPAPSTTFPEAFSDRVERLCRRIMIIDHGRVVFDGATADLRRRFAPHRLLDISVAPEDVPRLEGLAAVLPDGVTLTERRELGAVLTFDPRHLAPADAIAAVAARVPIIDLTVREPELEGIIRQIYESPEVMR